jgi:beta-phosphoglucomutase-like phosphatase (HAD superfamily)
MGTVIFPEARIKFFVVARLDDLYPGRSTETTGVPGVPSVLNRARGIVWDFDGVLADTEPAQAAAYQTVLSRYGVDLTAGWFFDYVGIPEAEIWQLLRRRYGITTSVPKLTAERTEAFLPLARACAPAWFVAKLLQVNCPHVIVSAGKHEHIVDLLEHWEIHAAFESVSAVGTQNQVPAPKPYRLAQACADASVLLEDMPTYLIVPINVVKVGVEHSYNDLTGVECDFVVSHYEPDVWISARGDAAPPY